MHASAHEDETNGVYDRSVNDLSGAIASVLNGRLRARARPTGVDYALGWNEQPCVTLVINDDGELSTPEIEAEHDRLRQNYERVQLMQRRLGLLYQQTMSLPKGSNFDISPWKDCLFDGCSHPYKADVGQLSRKLIAGHLAYHIETVCRPEIYQWLQEMLRVLHRSHDHPTVTIDELIRLPEVMHGIDQLADIVVVQSLHLDREQECRNRLRDLINELNATRAHQRRLKTCKIHEQIDLLEALVSATNASVFEDKRLPHVVAHPPKVLTCALRGSGEERCLQTLREAFNLDRPLDLRTQLFSAWTTTFSTQLVHACNFARLQLPTNAQWFTKKPSRISSFTRRGDDVLPQILMPSPTHVRLKTMYQIDRESVSSDVMSYDLLVIIADFVLWLLNTRELPSLVFNAALINSITMIVTNDQAMMLHLMHDELQRQIRQFNLDYATTKRELSDLSCGMYADAVYTASQMLGRHSLLELRSMLSVVIDANGKVRDPNHSAEGHFFALDVGCRIVSLLWQLPKVSTLFVTRSIALVLPAVVQAREHQQLMCSKLLILDPSIPCNSLTRSLLPAMLTHARLRELLTRLTIVRRDARAELTLTREEFMQLPMSLTNTIVRIHESYPSLVKMSNRRKRSALELSQRPYVVIDVSALSAIK